MTGKKQQEVLVWQNESKRNYLFNYSAELSNDGLAYFYEGSGASINQKIAEECAIYEAIERYCGSKIPKKLFKAKYKILDGKAINPHKLIPFSVFQYTHEFSYRKFSSDLEIEWVKGCSLTKRVHVYIPAFAVYLGYNRRMSLTQRFCPSTSCGLAIQRNFEGAITKGIFELIERDSAMLTWLERKSPLKIDLSSVKSKELKKFLKNIYLENLKAEVLLSTYDIPIPSVIGIIYSPKNTIPYVTFGLSANVGVERSILKSLEEALMVRNTLDYLQKKKKLLYPQKPFQVKTLLDHALYYAQPKTKRNWKFLLDGDLITVQSIEEKLKCSNLEEGTLEKLINLFKRLGYEVLVAELTTDLAKSMRSKCVRVIIPGLQTMEIDHNIRFLDVRIGPRNIINNLPHPFV